LNPFWVELRRICRALGITNWTKFEKVLKEGNVQTELLSWLMWALQAPPTDYGVETRETAKYYFALHPDEITPEIKKLLENPPKLTPEVELENYIRSCYFKVLGRHPDREGLESYKREILAGRLRREDLPKVLMASPEYREKMKLISERVKLQVPVDVNVRLTDELIIQALQRSEKWFSEVKPRLDLGSLIGKYVDESFWVWFYRSKDKITLKELIERLREYDS